MADRAKRKERRRLKREQKQRALRKASHASPFKRLAQASELVACYINSDWCERGQAVVYVLRRSGSTLAMASFLVDLWCCGLKDAWGFFDIDREEFDEQVGTMSEQMGNSMTRVDLAQAAQVVAGGVRFARQNGFRLPPRADRWLNFLGDLSECRDADLSAFGVEDGKLRYVGPIEDLRRRLIASDVETFMSRPDVEVILGLEDINTLEDEEDDESYDDDEEQEDDEWGDRRAEMDDDLAQEALSLTASKLGSAIRRWCFGKNLVPSPMLKEAIFMAILEISRRTAASLDDDAQTDTLLTEQIAAAAIDSMDAAQLADFKVACGQLAQFMGEFKSTEAMLESVGFGEEAQEGIGDGES